MLHKYDNLLAEESGKKMVKIRYDSNKEGDEKGGQESGHEDPLNEEGREFVLLLRIITSLLFFSSFIESIFVL